MAETRYHYVQRKDAPSTAASGTHTYDLPESGTIPEIILRAYSTPTASSAQALPLIEAITKIEIVDGATVIKSYDGEQCKALSMYHGNHEHHCTSADENAVEGYEDFRIVLGRKINGRLIAPDFSRFNNPQIKISWDYSATTTKHGVTCEADTAPAMKFTILCKIVENAGKYTPGYIKTSSIKTWTQATSTQTVIEIPRGEPLIGILIDAGYDTKDWTEDVEKIRLDFNNGEWVPLELYEDEIVKMQEQWFGEPFKVTFVKDHTGAEEIDTHMGYVTGVSIVDLEGSDLYAPTWTAGHKGVETVTLITSTSAAYSTVSKFQWTVEGYIPFQGYYIPMSAILDADADTVDTNKYRRIELELTSGSSASTSSTPEILAEYLILQ